jgi:transcription elongation factor Elf1
MRETWIGSGVNSVFMTREFTCRGCGWEGEADGSTDDWQAILYAECQNCGNIMEIDLDAERQHEQYFADPEDDWEN